MGLSSHQCQAHLSIDVDRNAVGCRAADDAAQTQAALRRSSFLWAKARPSSRNLSGSRQAPFCSGHERQRRRGVKGGGRDPPDVVVADADAAVRIRREAPNHLPVVVMSDARSGGSRGAVKEISRNHSRYQARLGPDRVVATNSRGASVGGVLLPKYLVFSVLLADGAALRDLCHIHRSDLLSYFPVKIMC